MTLAHMNAKQRFVRFLAAVIAALISCLFVSVYNWACSASYGHPNPAITDSVVRNAPYAYAVPIVMLLFGVGLFRSRKDRAVALESLISLLWIAAFAWALTAIFAWQLTHIEIWSGAGRNLR